jgi:predicted signal transduction protein with EAL and GGDEF domain
MILGKAMYKTADISLYDAKRDGRNKSYFFDFERDYASKNQHAIETVEETESKELK